MKVFDNAASRIAQKEICEKQKAPHFAPYDGFCYDCKKDIYSEIDHGGYTTGIPVAQAAAGVITGCPHCHSTYCD